MLLVTDYWLLYVIGQPLRTFTVMLTCVRLLLIVYGGLKIPGWGTFGAPLAADRPFRQSILHTKSVAGPAKPACPYEVIFEMPKIEKVSEGCSGQQTGMHSHTSP